MATTQNFTAVSNSPYGVFVNQTPTATSLVLDVTAWLGQNQIRRPVFKESSPYLGTSSAVESLTLTAAQFKNISFTTPTKALLLLTTLPVTVQVFIGGVPNTFQVNQILMVDAGVTQIVISNPSANTAQIQLVTLAT
jgi:hypothetical protein